MTDEPPRAGAPRVAPMAQLPLETHRLLLRPWRRSDAAAIIELLDDPEMAEHLAVIPHPFVAFDAQALVRAAWQRLTTGRGFDLAIVAKDAPDRPIGSVGLGLAEDGRCGELGFWIGRRHWGHGYATEAAARLVDFARDALHVTAFTATAAECNARSIAVLRKLGFAESGRGTCEVPSTGRRRAMIHFARDAMDEKR